MYFCFRTLATALVFGLLSSTCHAQGIELRPFSSEDEWTFVQQRSLPGQPLASTDIRLTVLKSKGGQNVLWWTRGKTNEGQPIFELLMTLPAASCLRDFVGRSDLNLPNSCREGLEIGKEWESRSNYKGASEQLTFQVTGREAVEVPVGKFNAIKIHGAGGRRNSDGSPENLTVDYWFVPELKAMARATREYRSPDGTLVMKMTEELKAAKVN